MVLTPKETMLLQDLKSQEQLCVEKYAKYAQDACDGQLKNLFTDIGRTEQGHLDSINQMLGGTVPSVSGGSSSDSSRQQTTGGGSSGCGGAEKQKDSYLCSDALATEKHVSAVYDTCIFEFSDAGARNVLNHIQKEEQQHGEKIYNYMYQNSMYG